MAVVLALLRGLALLILLLLYGVASARPAAGVRAVVFDYFVLFDASSLTPAVEQAFPGRGAEFVRTWRSTQFQYGFLRSITRRQTDFWRVTEDALVYTANVMHLQLTPAARQDLLQAYLHLKPWPDTEASLRKLKAAGVRILVLSNFSREMLRANAEGAGITGLIDDLISTEVNASYKPEPRAYALALERSHLHKEEVVFAAFGGWDAYGAKSFGYATYWVNRFSLPSEELGLPPDETSADLSGLLIAVLRRP